jgi:hypothetical protein
MSPAAQTFPQLPQSLVLVAVLVQYPPVELGHAQGPGIVKLAHAVSQKTQTPVSCAPSAAHPSSQGQFVQPQSVWQK